MTGARLPFRPLINVATGWDYLADENASRSIDLLCERIIYPVKLKKRIDALATSLG